MAAVAKKQQCLFFPKGGGGVLRGWQVIGCGGVQKNNNAIEQTNKPRQRKRHRLLECSK